MIESAGREPVITAVGVHKSYVGGDGSILEVLKGVDLAVYAGETVAIIGESGSGKSTLLHILGGLDRPSAGEVRVGSRNLRQIGDDELSAVRNSNIGFVFQFHHLLQEFTVRENVMMPQLISGRSIADASRRAAELISQVGLTKRAEHRPGQLSGGEQQRVAVARALANQPLALLADEPSGNLDPSTSERLHDLLFSVGAEHGTAMVLVTHNMQIARRSDRVLEVQDGQLVQAAAEAYELPG
jgi:lipoprotein-releasing system ATP-binding protein